VRHSAELRARCVLAKHQGGGGGGGAKATISSYNDNKLDFQSKNYCWASLYIKVQSSFIRKA
jgi:hypothetical protein